MISKLLIADVNVSDEMKSLLNSLKGDDVIITYYNYSQGFIVENKNLLVDKLLTLIRSHLETSTVNFEHLCFVNVEQMKTPAHSSKYNNENHAISGIESKPDALDSWNFMGKLVADIAKTTEIRNIDFIDIDHLCFPKEHAVIFDKIQEVTKDVEDRTINYLKVGEEDKETIYKSNNWLHTMMTTFYNDENKVLLDKYFKINNSNIGFLNTKILKPRNFQIYDSHVPSIDFESGTLNVSIIPLYCYASDADYDLMGDFIKSLNSNTILEFIHITDTMAEFKSRMIHILDKYCGENKDKINKVNVAVWLNPNISNQSLMFSNHISANIDQELAEVVNQLTTNNTENVDQLQNHFVVQVNEAFIEYFNMNVYDNMDVNIINFEIFNISDTYNTNYNLFCHFLHNDYYVSTLVNFNLTFITSSDITDNLFELSDKIVDFDEEGNIIDVSQSLFKDSQLMTDISNNETYHDDLFISNTSHINKSIQYNKDINLATYLSSDGPEIEKFMKQNVITNVILYDRELREHLSDVRGCLLPNTLLLTFDKQNTYQDIKDGLLRLNELNGVQISNIALFQDNDSRSKTYNFVGEETSIVKYPMMDDPSLNTWSKFQDFVLFLDTEMNVKYLDLMMCKIYSNPNWKYVIDTISSNLSSLVIRSSENNTGHTMFEGDWILESPVVDVNMINLYFKESIKELDIQLGDIGEHGDQYFNKITMRRHSAIPDDDAGKPGHMNVAEIEVWVNGTNVALSANGGVTASSSDLGNNTNANINDGTSNIWHTNLGNVGEYVSITIPQDYLIWDIEAIVMYHRPKTQYGGGHRENGCALELYKDDVLVSTISNLSNFSPSWTTFYRFDGYSINNVSNFSNTWDGNNIISSSASDLTYVEYNGETPPTPPPSEEISATDDFTTKFYNYNSGEALASTQEQIVIGSIEPKLLDSNGDELTYNTYTENSIEYKSYVFTNVGTTSVSLSHDTPVDFMVVAGGGGGGAEAMGAGGGAGGVVIGTQYSLSSGSYNIKVGDGGKSRAHYNRVLNSTEIDTFFRTPWQPYLTTSTYNSIASWGENWATDGEESFIQGTNVNFSAIGGGGGRRFINSSGGGSSSGSYGNGGDHDWPATTRFSSEPPLTLSHNALGYSSMDDYFIISNGSSNYDNDSTTYPNVMVYGNIGGGGTNLANGGGGGAGGPGTNGGEGDGRQAGHGGVGIESNFADGTSYYYAGGGAGGVHNSNDIGTGGLGGGGNSEVSGTANTGGGGGGHATQSNSPEGVWGSGMAGNGGSGIVVIRFPKTVNEYETKTINAFTESTTSYLNYDISVAEIKEYVAPVSTGGNTFGDISNVPEDFVFSTTQNAGTFTQGTTISIIDTLETSDDPNNNKSYTFTLSSNSVITELNFTPTNYSGDYTSLYYVIQENTNTILKQTNNTLQDENFIVSRVDFSNGTQDLLQVGDTKVIIENNTNENKDYVLLFYTLEGTGSALLDSGKLNRYLYDGYGGTEYTNIIPAWSYFSTFNSSALVTNTAIPDRGDYYNYLYDGYVYYTETTTKHFGTTGDDDTFVWIVEGDKKWSTVGHPHRAGYSWIVNNIPNATLVCYRGGRGGPNSTYTGTMFGSYTFQANTLYTILMKFTEHSGGINFSFGISNSSLNNQTRRTTTFPSQFHATVGAGGIAQGSSLEYSITSDSITPPVVDISSQIVSLSAGVYNVVIDKPAVSEPISTDDLQMEYIANTNTSTTTTWTSTYTADGTSHDMNIPSWPLTTTNDEYYYTIDNKNSAYPYYPTASKNYHYNDLDDCTTTGQKGLTYEAWIYVDSWPADGTEPGTSSADPKRGAWGWLMGLHTGNAMYLILNQEAIGGIGMHPPANRSTHGTTYELNNGTSLTNPGYITENTQQLLHIVGYMYPTSTTDVERGVYINGTHYPQFSLLQSNSAIPDMFNNQTYNFTINNLQNDWFGACKTTRLYSFRVWHRQLTETEINSIYSMGPYGSILSQPTSDISTNITLDLSTNTITSNVDFEIKYTPIDLSLSELTKDTTINPVRSQTIPFVKSNGNQEERSVTLHGDATYNRFANEYYFPGDLSGYASIEGQLFGEHAMSMSFMYKSGGEQPVLEVLNDDNMKIFNSSGTLTLTEDVSVDILIVGGGGAGGRNIGGGGGAGGVVYTVNQTMTAGTYNIVVGDGGVGEGLNMSANPWYAHGPGENGEDSYITDAGGNILAMNMGGVSQELKGLGGGGGGSRNEDGVTKAGSDGGSGGGLSQPNDNSHSVTTSSSLQPNTYWNGNSYIQGGYGGTDRIVIANQDHWGHGTGGGGLSGTIYYKSGYTNDEPHIKTNGQEGISIPITSPPTIVAAGGGGAQYKHHDTHMTPNLNYGFGGLGEDSNSGNGSVYITSNANYRLDGQDQAGYKRLQTDGAANTGSGGGGRGGSQGNDPGNDLAGSGGSGIVIIKIHLDPPPPVRNTITYIGHPYPSPLNQNAHDTNDFAIYSSPNDQASIFYKEDDTSIKEVPSATFDNSSNYTHIAITMNEDLTLNETNGFKMYVNGVLEKSGNLSANNGALISGVSQPLQLLGKGPLSGSSQSSAFKGYLKNVRFYDSVLSQSQVSTIYTNMITNEYTDNKNFVSQVVPNVVISSSDISSGEHTETTSISMEITATTDSSLNIASSDINVTNGTISNFTNNTTNTWSFDFTPASSNVESTLSISENSLFDNTINNMTDKPSWFSDYNNHASNMFKFMKTDVEMDLMPPLQDQTIAMITSTGSHIEIPVTLNGTVTYDASKNEYDISENGYLSIDEDVIRDGDLTISMMYAMRSGNQYGNDQLVNFSDSNSLNTSSDSTDIHIFRDGTTPGAWFYYGSPDDNGMAISEAGLEPSLVNTQVTQQGEFDSGLAPKYTHMAITVKEGQVKRFYINGEVVDYVNKYRSNAIPVSRAIVGGKRQHQLFGYGYAANRGFSGLMKNIRIYNKALTSYEMRHLYAINSNFNDNDFSNTTVIPVPRPTLTFSAPLPESKILDSNGAEMTFNSFVKNGKEYKAYSFTNTGTTSITLDLDATDVEILIVGGGGAGGFWAGGGGGAGGVVYAVNQTLTAGTYNIEVGAGGVGWRQGGGVVPTSIGGDGIYHSQSGLDSYIHQETETYNDARYVKFETTGAITSPRTGVGLQFFQVDVIASGTITPITNATIHSSTRLGAHVPASNVLVDYESDGTTSENSNGHTYWAGTGGQNSYFVMDLGQVYSLFQYRMKNTNNGVYGDRWTEDFKISISTDGVNFFDRISNTLQKNIKMTQAFKATKPAISMNMGGVSHELRGVGGGGGGNIINHDSGSQAAGVSGGSGGGSSGPWNNSSNNTIYTGGTATQGNTLYDISAQSYVAGGNNGNTLIGDALQTTNYKPIMGMGGGGASAIIYNDDDTDTGWSHVNGKNGIEIDIGGSTLTVAAGGGGSQMGYHQGWHGPPVKYNTDIIRGLGGSGGVGGDGMLWTSASENGWYQHLMGKDYPAHYKRLASDGADNTGSGGGGSQPGESGSAEAYYTSGSGGSGIVIIQFPKAEVASGSSLDQSTLDLTLTASDDGLDGNISSSDIITSNGTITAFSQTSPTTWDLTYTSDYTKQSNVGSLFIEQDTIYNRDVSDAFAPEPTIKYVVFQRVRVNNDSPRETAIGEIECVLNDNTNVALASNGATAEIYEDFTITDNVASWSTVNTFMASWTNGNYWADKAINGTTTGNFLHINHGTLLVSTVITLQDIHTLDAVQYLYVHNRHTDYLDRITGQRFVLLDEDKNVVATTNEITVGEVEYTFNYSELNLQGDSFTPPSWWTREHNKASNKFEWTALNSGASDTSTTPTRPSITFSSLDLNHGESQNLGTVPMTIYVSSNNLNVAQADLSFSNGVVSNFTKVSNNYYTFDFKSESVSQPSSVYILQDTVSNAETSTDFNEASNVFEWTWSFTVTPPEITITSSDVTHGGNFGVQEVNMLLEFSGEVLHGNSIESTFSQFDVSAVNGYVFDISVISQSQIAFKLGSSSIAESTSVFIPQNIVSRTFNNIYTVNTNNVSNVFTWKYDSADLTISSLMVNDANGNVISAGDYINENELWLQFTFSESIFNFNKSYFDTTNCKIANISSDTTFTTFTVKVETFFPTTASLQVKTDKFITSGRGLQKYVTGANNLSFNWNYDNTKPQISMTSSQASGLTNNVAFVDLSFISTIDTSDFTENSITVTGDASLSNFTAISATEYSVRVTPNSVSNIDITVPVNAYTEQYGNGNENSVSFSWNYDNVPPTVEIFSPDIANGASSSDPYINIYFTLSKPVDDFVLNDDVDLANGSFGPMTKTNTFVNHTTTFNVTVATKTASHPYNGSGSSAGYFLNGVESPTIDFIVGQTYTFNQSDSTNSTHPLKFYTTAEKDVLYTSGVVYTDSQGTSGATTTITIDENTPSPLFYQCANHGFMGYKGVVSKKESYTAKLYPMQNDTVSVYIFANSITDSAGNQNTTDSNEFDWIFDSNDLLTTLSSSNVANNGTFSNDSITISLATTAAIVDFVEADISYQNGTISNVDSSAKTFNITSNTQGVPTTAFIIGGAVETTQGESNIESNTFTWTYNPPIPKLVIKSSQINEGDYTNISSIDFTLTFDQENVIFDQNSLSIYNGTISSFSGSGTTYQVTVDTSVVSDDLIRLTLPQGNAYVADNGNHYNDVSYNFEWNYDSVAPSITIGSSLVTQDASSTLTSLVLTLNSSEHIDGLRLSDFDVSNGVVSDLTNEGGLEDSSGSSYTLTIQPLDDTTDCSINICLNANSVVDRAGNTNAKSNDFGYSYIFFSRKLESSAIVELFEDDPEIPQEEKLSSSEIDLVISAAFTIPDTASPFAVAENESSDTGENDSSEQTDGEAIFVKPPKITFPPAIKIKNRKVFTKLIDQIFATASESVTTLTIDKSSVAVSASAEAEIADVEEVVMVKSNQTEPVDMSALIEDPTKPSATYIPLANIGDFAIVAIGGVEYTTVVEGEGIFLLSSNNGGVIDNPNSGDGKWHSNDVYQATDINKIIFGSQIISTSPVSPDPPTLTITSGQVSGGGTTDISYIDLSFVFSTTVEISLNDIEALNANTTIISRTIVTDGSDSHIAVTIAPVDLCDNTIGVFVDVSAFYDSNNIFNDVQYTYSWNYSLDGGSSENGGTSDFIPCFLEGTKILTTKGYKNVELLNPKKDKLLDKDNNTLNFLDIQKYSQENNGKQYPYKIPHGSALSEDYTCNRDLYLTYNHCVYLPHLNKFAPVSAMKHLKEDKSLTQKKFTYYHVFTENYFSDTLMANGIPCESHSKYTFAKLRNIDPSDKLLRSVIKKADMLPNCMRNRLSIKEMKQVVKKFNRKQNKRKIKTK